MSRQRVPKGSIRSLMDRLRYAKQPVDRPTFQNPNREQEAREHLAETMPVWDAARGRADLEDLMRRTVR